MSRIPIVPVVTPAVEEKIYDALWLTSLATDTPYPGCPGTIALTWKPVSQEGELFNEEMRITSDVLMQAVDEVPELKNAFFAILGAITPFKQWVESKSIIVVQSMSVLPAPSPDVIPNLPPEVIQEPIEPTETIQPPE